jgi:hypothetical protein
MLVDKPSFVSSHSFKEILLTDALRLEDVNLILPVHVEGLSFDLEFRILCA